MTAPPDPSATLRTALQEQLTRMQQALAQAQTQLREWTIRQHRAEGGILALQQMLQDLPTPPLDAPAPPPTPLETVQ